MMIEGPDRWSDDYYSRGSSLYSRQLMLLESQLISKCSSKSEISV